MGRVDGEAIAIEIGGPGRQFCPQFMANGNLAIADYQDLADAWEIRVSARGPDGAAGEPSYTVPVSILPNDNDECFEGSFDGSRFAFLSRGDDETGDAHLYVVSADGAMQEVVLPADDRDGYFFDFNWSPDGTRLGVVRLLADPAPNIAHWSEIWVVDLDSNQSRHVLTAGRDEVITDLAWSPAGDRLAFRGSYMEWTQVDGQPQGMSHGTFVRVFDPTGPEIAPIEIDALRDPDIDAGANVAWSPDGSQLAWILDGELRVGGSSGGSWRSLPPVSSDELGMGWATGPVRWSPDGRQVMVGQLDTPEADPDAAYSVVVYDPASDAQPTGFLTWRDGDIGRITWQSVLR
jgi:Tol biopolymer transport system component